MLTYLTNCPTMWMLLLMMTICVLMNSAIVECTTDIKLFPMHELCGKKISLKHEVIFSAEIIFDPSNIIGSSANLGDRRHNRTQTGLYHMIESCDLEIESWSFMNKIMFFFKDIHIDANCQTVNLELLDGYLADVSPPVQGTPNVLCNSKVPDVLEKTFVTTDRNLLIRFHSNRPTELDTHFELVIVSYHDGDCKSYEHECLNGRCIMEELVCSGHNPCGDHSDCPQRVGSQIQDGGQLASGQDHVMLIVVICMASCIVLLVIGAIVVYKFHLKRRKNRRNDSAILGGQTTASGGRPHVPLRTISQYEAERLAAPPSYNSLPVQEENTTDIEPLNDVTTGNDDTSGALSRL